MEIGSEFDTIEFSATEGSSYKIGGINILVADGTVDQSTGVTLVGTDGDNDATAAQTIDLTFSSNETLEGSSGEDVITGGSGDDIITGGLGNDILVGGDGEDTFIFNMGELDQQTDDGVNVIKDFSLADDILGFHEVLDAGEIIINVSGDDITLTTDTGSTSITLEDVNSGGPFTDYDGQSLQSFIDTPDAPHINVDTNPDTYAS